MRVQAGRVLWLLALWLAGVAGFARAQALDTTLSVPDGPVFALALQPDGRILVGGGFMNWNALGATPSRLARLNADGTVDMSFRPNPGGDYSNAVLAIALQADGAVVIGGQFSWVGGGANIRRRIARINPNGTLDTGWDAGADDYVNALAVQDNGGLIVGGNFLRLGGGGYGTSGVNRLGRLRADATLDRSFVSEANGPVYALAIQPDGKILVGGSFTALGTVRDTSGAYGRYGIGRLNADGSVDQGFNPGVGGAAYGAPGTVKAIAVQPDGRIVIGGNFTTVGGGFGNTPRKYLARLNPDGSVDPSFNPGVARNDLTTEVKALLVQADGSILVGGNFTSLGGGDGTAAPRNHLGRLNPDGSVDDFFDPGADTYVHAFAEQADLKVLVGGVFGTFSGGGRGTVERAFLGRLMPGTLGLALPGAPRALSAWTTAGSTINLSWQYPGGGGPLTGYLVEAGSGPGLANLASIPTSGSGTTFSAAGVPAGVYYLRIRARNASGLSLPSNEMKLVVGPQPPGAPNAVAASVSGSTISLAWTAPSGGGAPTAYTIEAGSRSGLGPANLANFSTGSTATTFSTAGVPAGTYFVRVRATNGSGAGIASNEVMVVVGGQDASGAVDAGFNPGANGDIVALARQPDGKLLVGGTFTMIGGGGTGSTPRNRIARLLADGSVDASFNPGANGYVVRAIVVQPDGRILVGGDFTTIGGQPRNGIARLQADGSVDSGFNPGKTGYVNALALQPDGRLVVGGAINFGSGPQVIDWIGRLQANGSVDTSFAPGANDLVFGLALQADGKILVVGRFGVLGGGGKTVRRFIGRLNADGSVDAGFNPGANSEAYAVAVQPDGKILLGGNFQALGGGTGTTARRFIGRLNADGSVDASFNPGASGGVVTALALQPDGKILAGGSFAAIGGGTGTTARLRVARLLADGAVDAGFNPGADGAVSALLVQPDGKLVLGGGFGKLGGGSGSTARSRIGRLLPDAPTPSAPQAPGGLAGLVAGSTVTLSWTAPATGEAPTAYLVEAGSAPGRADVALLPTGSAATSFATQGLPQGQHYLRVRAMNAAGTSASSDEAVVTVGCMAAPNVPTWLTLTQNSGGRVALRWNAALGVPTSYRLEAGSAPDLADLADADLGGTATSFAASGIGAGTYYVRVRARNACGLSGPSNQLAVVVPPH
ncbi:hypothetical protein [Aquabacterium sp.]|uniref:hypothetical protein n=1 Tax=Aquabacterium sp. TaxID=1872578 RepID=UPI00378303E7